MVGPTPFVFEVYTLAAALMQEFSSLRPQEQTELKLSSKDLTAIMAIK